jgi:hypothetical protein
LRAQLEKNGLTEFAKLAEEVSEVYILFDDYSAPPPQREATWASLERGRCRKNLKMYLFS